MHKSYLTIKGEILMVCKAIQEALVDQELKKNINYKNLASKQILIQWQVTFPTLDFEYIKVNINHLFSNSDSSPFTNLLTQRSCKEMDYKKENIK